MCAGSRASPPRASIPCRGGVRVLNFLRVLLCLQLLLALLQILRHHSFLVSWRLVLLGVGRSGFLLLCGNVVLLDVVCLLTSCYPGLVVDCRHARLDPPIPPSTVGILWCVIVSRDVAWSPLLRLRLGLSLLPYIHLCLFAIPLAHEVVRRNRRVVSHV